MAYKDMQKKKEANRRAKAKLLARDPDYFKNWSRQYRKENPELIRSYEKRRTKPNNVRQMEYYYRNKDKVKARAAARYAVKVGKLVKPKVCDWCGLNLPLQIDHYDYSKPLDVNFLCKDCHSDMTVTRLRGL